MAKTTMLKSAICPFSVLLVALAASVTPAWGQSGQVTDIYVLGRPATTFSPHPPRDLEELKDLFDRFEADLRVVLEKGGWGGDPDDFFETIRAAQAGDGTVTRRTVQPGETFQWMAYRKGGKPDVIRNPRWSAKTPLDTWQIMVESGGTEYIFFVPVTCMNLAYDTSRPAPAPTCHLEATFDAEADSITVVGKSDAESFEITAVQGPGGVGTGDLKSAGAMRWTLQPTADGRYDFAAKASTGKRSSTCSASVQVVRAKPVCDIDATADPETNLITVDASGSRGEFSLTGVTLPDGTAGKVSDMQSVAAQRWTYDPSASLRKKPGTYTYTFSAESTLHGFDSSCEAAAVITREAPEFRWIARGYYVDVSPGTEFATTEDRTVVGPPILTSFDISDGSGVGFDVEYMARPNLGVAFSGIFSDMDAHFMYDRGPLWLMDDDDVDLNIFSVGANYHFTPERRADFFLGAFVGLVQYDDVEFALPEIGETVVIDFDDDVGFGLNAGLDVPFKQGGPWVFTAGLRYMLTALEAEGSPEREIGVDPLLATIGIGFRF